MSCLSQTCSIDLPSRIYHINHKAVAQRHCSTLPGYSKLALKHLCLTAPVRLQAVLSSVDYVMFLPKLHTLWH
ncbi:MAG: hypothetical protein MESAZ_02059 [Saezia sanguinis]